jgi:Hemopexin
MGTKVYFFKNSQCVRYDRSFDAVDEGYPLGVAGNWPGLAEAGMAQPSAAVNLESGKLYVFKGGQYARYDVATDQVDAGYPLSIADFWPGMAAAGFGSDIDAAVNWGNGKLFFFKGGNYVRYDIAQDKVEDGYPLTIAGFWPGMAEAGLTGESTQPCAGGTERSTSSRMTSTYATTLLATR